MRGSTDDYGTGPVALEGRRRPLRPGCTHELRRFVLAGGADARTGLPALRLRGPVRERGRIGV